MRTFGQVIRERRKSMCMTQAELATKMGVTPQTISQYERGLKNPKHKTIEKYAKALGCTPDEIYSEMYIESEGKSKMSEEMSLPNNWDGELKIYNLEDRLAVSTILIKNGYDVGQHQRKKDQNSKALDYFLHFTAVNGNTASK